RAPRKHLTCAGTGLVAASSRRGNDIESLFFQVLVEFRSGQFDQTCVAAIPDDEEARSSDEHEPGGIRSVAARHWLSARRVDHNELIDEGGIAWHGIAKKVLPDTQFHADDLASLW